MLRMSLRTPAAAAFGCLPTQDTIVLERFFDEAGGMQLVIHGDRGFAEAYRQNECIAGVL
jgi:hypothetical protein